MNRDCPHCSEFNVWPDKICPTCHRVIFAPSAKPWPVPIKQYPEDRASMTGAEISAAVVADLDSGHE